MVLQRKMRTSNATASALLSPKKRGNALRQESLTSCQQRRRCSAARPFRPYENTHSQQQRRSHEPPEGAFATSPDKSYNATFSAAPISKLLSPQEKGRGCEPRPRVMQQILAISYTQPPTISRVDRNSAMGILATFRNTSPSAA